MKVLASGFVIVVLMCSFVSAKVWASTQSEEATIIAPPRIVFLTNQDIFIPGDTLVVYGKGFANDNLTIRIFDSGGKAIRIETLQMDKDGVYIAQIFKWPEPTRNFVYGRYTIELSSSVAPSYGMNKTTSFSDTPSMRAS